MSGPDSWNSKSIRHESEGSEFEYPSGRDIFCLKNIDTLTRTPVRVSKMNAVARALLTFQISNVNFKSTFNTPPPPPPLKSWYLMQTVLH